MLCNWSILCLHSPFEVQVLHSSYIEMRSHKVYLFPLVLATQISASSMKSYW